MFIQNVMIVFLVGIILLTGMDPAFAAGGKKKKSKTDLEVEKQLTPIEQKLEPLSQKATAKGLFSPADVAQATQLKMDLLDLIHDYPTNEQLAKPAYEAGELFKFREQYDDAYDFYNYIQTNFTGTPYAAQAKVQIQRMKQTLGQNYFSDAAAPLH